MGYKILYSETADDDQFITDYTEEIRAGEKDFEYVRPPPGLLYQFLRFPIQQNQRPVRAGTEEFNKLIRGLEHLCCAARLREFGLFNLK